MIADECRLRKEYLAAFLRSKPFVKGACECVAGAKMPRISRRDVLAARIPLPSLRVQQELCDLLTLLHELLMVSNQWTVKLDALVKSRFVEMFDNCGNEAFLGDVCRFQSGKSFSKDKELTFGEYLYAKVGDLSLPENETIIRVSRTYVNAETASKQLIPPGAVVFPKRGGAIGTNKKRITGEACCLDLNLMSVIPGNNICSEYLLAWFNQMNLSDIANGSTVPQINNKDLAPLIIPLPPLYLQQEFADFVAQVDKSRFVVQLLMGKYNGAMTAIEKFITR